MFVNNAEYGALTRKGKALPGAYGENGVYENIAFKQFTTNNTFRDFFISSINIKLPIQNERMKANQKTSFWLSAGSRGARTAQQGRRSRWHPQSPRRSERQSARVYITSQTIYFG